MADMPGSERPIRPFAELRESGLLWLVNKVVFHPRGFALALTMRDGEPVGWKLLGDGSEPWQFGVDADDEGFAAAETTLREHLAAKATPAPVDAPEVDRG